MNGIVHFFLDFLKAQDDLIIYGCGNNGKFLQWILCQYDIQISHWCDGNQNFWGKKFNDILCLSPQQLSEHRHAVVIVSMSSYKEVMPKLAKLEFAKIFTWDEVKSLKTELYTDKELVKKFRKWHLEQSPDMLAILERNKRFKNLHYGKRCFILGNGPSIREQDLSLLRNEVVFTVNQMARNPQFQQINTKYHLWADPNFFKTEFTCEGDYQLLELMKQLPKDTECFFPYNCAIDYIYKFELYKCLNINYYCTSELVNEEEEIDFTEFIRRGATVIQYAIRLAIYMGFKDIYILGCECTTILNVINARTSRYTVTTHAYDIDEKEKERAKKMYDSLPMQAYYKSEWRVLEEYHVIGEYCKQREIKLVNCTSGGLLDEFERADYEEVVNSLELANEM